MARIAIWFCSLSSSLVKEKMSNPLFSVIVPVYNVEDYLPQCIDSVVGQDFKEFELILVDDGSSDNSGVICDKYKNQNDKVKVIHKENGGASTARNIGLKNAIGEYIIFIDSDDYLLDNSFLSKLFQRISLYNEDVILYGCKTLLESGKLITSRGKYSINIINKHNKKETLNYLQQSYKFPGAAWIMAVRKSIIKDTTFPVGVTGEDYYWVIKMLFCSETIGAINEEAYCYRKREGSVTSSKNVKGLKGICLAIDYWLENPEKDENVGITNFMQQTFATALMLFSGLSKEERRSILPDVKTSSKILYFGSKKIYILYRILGPFVIGKLSLLAYKIIKKSHNG